MNKIARKTALALAVTAALGGHNMVQAQAMLEEIIVTAQKRAESLQDVPISVSAMSGDKIQDAGITNFASFSDYVPNFSVSSNAISDTIAIRGISTGSNAAFEQAIGTYVDGVYRGRGVQTRFAFLDVGRIEVLRGPQGTLFGKNTIGGALNITSAQPTDELEASLSNSYEFELDQTIVEGFVSGPLSDTVRGRLAFNVNDMSEGWTHNSFYDADEPDTEQWAVRGALAWDASDSLSITVKYEHGDFDVTGAPYEIIEAGPHAALFESVGIDGKLNGESTIGNVSPAIDIGSSFIYEGDMDEFALTADYQLAGATLTTLIAHSAYEFDRAQDADFGPLDVTTHFDTEEFEQDSVEIRLASDNDNTIQYIVGVYWQQNELDLISATSLNTTPLGVPLPAVTRNFGLEQDSDTWAVFGQATWALTDTFRLTGGLRYTEETKDARQFVVASAFGEETATTDPLTLVSAFALFGVQPHDFDDLERDEESLTPSINIQWDVSDATMLYASASTGFKSGGFNVIQMSNIESEVEFEEEDALAFEIGAKMTLLDGAAELNVALYRTEFDDMQVSLFSATTQGFTVGNAASAVSQGIELDGRWQITDKLMLRGSAGYIDFEFEDFATAGCTADQEGAWAVAGNPGSCEQDLSGKTNQDTPELSASLGLEYNQPIGAFDLTTQIDINYSDEYFATSDLDPHTVQDSFTKVNANITFGPQDGFWDVSLIGKNLTDEDTFKYANDVPLFAGAHFVGTQQPRTIAVRGRLHF